MPKYPVCARYLSVGTTSSRVRPEAIEVIKHVKTENFGALWNHPEMGNQTFDMLKDRIKHFHVYGDIFGPNNETYWIWRSA